MYCVSFDISLADLSRYAVNEIGVVIEDRKIEQPNDGDMIRQADVKQKTNKVFQFMDGWEKFCGTFVGTGQEEFILSVDSAVETTWRLRKLVVHRG